MNKLINIIMKRPIKIIISMIIFILIAAIGITNISLKTGNDTLISDKTQEYKDNDYYQTEFGMEPIVLLFEDDEVFSMNSLALMNEIQNEVKDLNGIYAINSPITMIDKISNRLYQETNSGLLAIGNNLITMGEQLQSNSNDIDLSNLTNMLSSLGASQNLLSNNLDILFSEVDMLKLVVTSLSVDVNTLKTSLESKTNVDAELEIVDDMIINLVSIDNTLNTISSNSEIKDIPNATVTSLNNIITQIQNINNQLNSNQQAMNQLSTTLISLGNKVLKLQSNFNAFKPDFPTEESTLNFMVYENNEIRDGLESFIVSESRVRMVIVLEGGTSNEKIDHITNTITNIIKENDATDEVLVSGKPVLDRAIKSSMTESMKVMMITAIIVMIIILIVTFKVRLRLLPIFMIIFVVIATIGIMGWLDLGLTMVSMAVFPILIGLGIDYFIQFQTRYEEERAKL